jgi:hypothetical protein
MGMTILLPVLPGLPALAAIGAFGATGGAWVTAALAASFLGYALVTLAGTASGRPRLFLGRHRRPAA